MIPLIPLNIAATAIVIGIVILFAAVILAHFTAGKPDDNGLIYTYQMRKH
jgi:hypothetical protein